jgi:hypothetical protein
MRLLGSALFHSPVRGTTRCRAGCRRSLTKNKRAEHRRVGDAAFAAVLVLAVTIRSDRMVNLGHSPAARACDDLDVGMLSPQPWPWRDRPRVLLEDADDLAGLEAASELRRVGFAVAICCGPSRRTGCPVVAGEPCCAAEGADVIISALGGEPHVVDIPDALRARYPKTPVVVMRERANDHVAVARAATAQH